MSEPAKNYRITSRGKAVQDLWRLAEEKKFKEFVERLIAYEEELRSGT